MTDLHREAETRQDNNPGSDNAPTGGKEDLNAEIPLNPKESEEMDHKTD